MIKTDDTQKMLRTIINGQSAFKQEVLKRFDGVDKKFVSLEGKLSTKIDNVERNLTKRIDALGKQLAYLDDDTPTREEFDGVEKRVQAAENELKIKHAQKHIPTDVQ